MPKEILHNLYKLEIPLPRSPLKALNAYLIKGGRRSLLIDTGMQFPICRQTMLACLNKLGIDRANLDFFITHLHADHLGLLQDLATPTSGIYFNRIEAAMISSGQDERAKRWQSVHSYFKSNGFPETELKTALAGHMGFRLQLDYSLSFKVLGEGDSLDAGDYHFTCIETPGHSPGHTCLYEASKKLLLSGDHILFDITPNITFWPGVKNSLGDYLASLDKVYDLDIDMVLPGHRAAGSDHKKRIRELRKHHDARAEEILDCLQDGLKTAYDIAPHVTWDIVAKSWDEFPAPQKWFAVGETIAHLHYLEAAGKVQREIRGDTTLFSLA